MIPAERAHTDPVPDAARRRGASNRRTALVLVSVAVMFFVGIIATRFIGSASTGISVMGAAVLLFLVIAIGRHLWSGR